MVLVGDVEGKIAILVDDMADTCGTLVKAADTVMHHGAKEVVAIVTHGILSGKAIETLNGSKLSQIVVTNTVPHEQKKERCERLRTIDISPTVSSYRLTSFSHHTFLSFLAWDLSQSVLVLLVRIVLMNLRPWALCEGTKAGAGTEASIQYFSDTCSVTGCSLISVSSLSCTGAVLFD